ncbi:TPA: hypothetical protein JI093_06305 [Acinetobacter baumannii]|nr:hypothetical protein [Acinetobacter baumannii]
MEILMNVEVRVISGKNIGKVLDLLAPPVEDACYFLCEDDSLEFIVRANQPYPNIHLALHEIFIPPTHEKVINGENIVYEYIWNPRQLVGGWGYEAFFHNFCGLAELLIVEKIQTSYEDFDLVILNHLTPIEILAKKINVDRINAMLSFLSREDGRDLAALARITRKFSGYKEGDKTIAHTLDRVGNYISFLEDAIPKILRKPIVGLTQSNKYMPYTNQSNISEDTIINLLEAPDLLFPVTDVHDSIIRFDNQMYGVDNILETIITEETNLYENQVVHGFMELLIRSIKDIQKKLLETRVKNKKFTVEGYESLFNKLAEFNLRLNQPFIERCSIFVQRIAFLKSIIEKRLKVKKYFLNEPYFTHKVKQNPTYQLLFKKMIEWMRFGTPDWSLQNELNSIQDLSKLFEFYLFCVSKEHILNFAKQYKGGISESPLDGSNDSRFIFKFGDGYKIELFYELDIYEKDVNDALLMEYRNTEAWKPISNRNYRLRRDNLKTSKSFRYRRTPDVVVRLSKSDKDSLLLMDAKYMNSDKAFREAMPECVMKYIHGIHKKNGINTSIGLMIVNPDEKNFIRHFHHDRYSIFGDSPVFPAIMTTSIDVASGHKYQSPLQQSIFKLIELMIDKVDPLVNEDEKDDAEKIYLDRQNYDFDARNHYDIAI